MMAFADFMSNFAASLLRAGLAMRSEWDASCTHLVMGDYLQITNKVGHEHRHNIGIVGRRACLLTI